jgi:hypothetical protein
MLEDEECQVRAQVEGSGRVLETERQLLMWKAKQEHAAASHGIRDRTLLHSVASAAGCCCIVWHPRQDAFMRCCIVWHPRQDASMRQ